MKRPFNWGGGLAVLLILLGCRGYGQPSPEVYTVLEPPAFKAKLAADSSVLLVDVRRPDEYEAGAIEPAVNANMLDEEGFEAFMEDVDRERPLMLYCRSGRRSRRAAAKLEAMGFTRIFDLEGGFLAWKEAEDE